MPAVIEPPGELMYSQMSLFGSQEALEYGFVDKLVSTHDTMNTTKE